MDIGDRHLRARERRLAGAPDDLELWVQLSRDYERVGRAAEACEVAVRAARHHGDDPRLAARLREVGCGDGVWPTDRGPASATGRSVLEGPTRGVLRWRAELPRAPWGSPLVDVAGGALVRLRPAGLARVDREGRRVDWADPDWPVEVAPVLWGNQPAGYDPARHDLRAVAVGERGAPWWSGALGPDGWRYGLGPGAVEAVSPSGELAWSARLPRPVALAAGRAAVHVAVADPQVRRGSPFDSPGRVVTLDASSGAVLREVDLGRSLCGDGQLGAAVAPDGALVAQLGMDLACVEPDGAVRWQTKLEWAGAPAVGAEHVVVASPTEGLVALDLATGARRWRVAELRTARAPLIDARGVAYACGAGWVAAVDLGGAQRFLLRPTGVGPLGPPALGPERTLLVPADAELLAVG